MKQTDLSLYNNAPYQPGGSALKRLLWYYVNWIFLTSGLVPSRAVKVFFLRLFGAKIGKGVNIKPGVSVKYPWRLTIGHNSWIGENVWIDCLVDVVIGENVCISQGAVILTGGHDYKKATFDLITRKVILEDGVWICAGGIVNPGVVAASHAVLTSGSVANKNLDAWCIYQGNPAVMVRKRIFSQMKTD
ncbi:WcaF family extracellular polysaccharide biosynthesis acetyltransferase [Mucilaginibacter xinganensis]|uniref:Colanic acid biosynthesis acetyltransferase WcaF n=1 Tax=Mucilaginibacter xinganensis TaxID=1234841 RepID=A0A223P3T1_9SPHI|nr:WcaF family extracellular polysaccharide biosynthesis acetyltransferase [Mucilaginibacter xinganensis]ASU36773.1 colanic acid biosynthesis acetyltransferase WcaF [Mucilaginibacter xinganensis]